MAAQYGYIRVSSVEQNEARQVIAMREAGLDGNHIYMDKQSGKDFDRPQYQRLVRRVDIRVLDMPLLDTRQGRDLMDTFIADLVLQILSFVAQSERESIKKRQAEGIAAAKARGVKFGRSPLPLPENFHDVHRDWRAKKVTLRQAAERCAMPEGTFYAKAVRLERGDTL